MINKQHSPEAPSVCMLIIAVNVAYVLSQEWKDLNCKFHPSHTQTDKEELLSNYITYIRVDTLSNNSKSLGLAVTRVTSSSLFIMSASCW